MEGAPETLQAELTRPRTIWAPDGTRFDVRIIMNDDVRSPEDLNDMARLLQYEVRGPDDEGHLWLVKWDGEFVANPTDDDVPRHWTTKANIAVNGWLQLNQDLGQ